MLSFFKYFFLSKQAKAVLGVLDELSCSHASQAFKDIKERISSEVLAHSGSLKQQLDKGATPRGMVYGLIARLAADQLQSGQHHIYRGVLNSLGSGQEYLDLFNFSINGLVEIGLWTKDEAEAEKKKILVSIQEVG